MKKLILIVCCAVYLAGCVSSPISRKSLSQTQSEILACSDSYMNCLEETRKIEEFVILDAAVSRCVEMAKGCSK